MSKTEVEYEAMIGGLKRQLDDAYQKASTATYQWEAWMDRAKRAEAMVTKLKFMRVSLLDALHQYCHMYGKNDGYIMHIEPVLIAQEKEGL